MKESIARIEFEIKKLNDEKYAGYFEEKHGNIERLEKELNHISTLTPQQWRDYRNAYCPKIKTRHGLAVEIFYWQAHYKKQILNVISYLKEQRQCQIHTGLPRREVSLVPVGAR